MAGGRWHSAVLRRPGFYSSFVNGHKLGIRFWYLGSPDPLIKLDLSRWRALSHRRHLTAAEEVEGSQTRPALLALGAHSHGFGPLSPRAGTLEACGSPFGLLKERHFSLQVFLSLFPLRTLPYPFQLSIIRRWVFHLSTHLFYCDKMYTMGTLP